VFGYPTIYFEYFSGKAYILSDVSSWQRDSSLRCGSDEIEQSCNGCIVRRVLLLISWTLRVGGLQ